MAAAPPLARSRAPVSETAEAAPSAASGVGPGVLGVSPMSGYCWRVAGRAGSAVILAADRKWRQSLSEAVAAQNRRARMQLARRDTLAGPLGGLWAAAKPCAEEC